MCTENDNLIEDHFAGDTWNGMELTLEELQEDGVTVISPINLTGCSVRSQFRKTAKGSVAFEFKTDDDTILITDAAAGKIEFQARKMDYEPGSYIFDVEVTFADGCVKTLFKDAWNIVNDISHD